LLYPIAAFLQEGGFSKIDAVNALSAAFERLQKRNSNRRMQHIGHTTPYADIIAAWTRNREYVDPSGRPRALHLSGPNSFASLVERTSPDTSVQMALTVLLRYRNIRRSKNGKYHLVKPFFYTNSNDATAFEPIAFFLSDASTTLADILKRQDGARRPEPFWRKVESISVSDSIARKFVTFARERSLIFLEELDDWLEAHRDVSRSAPRKRRRVGLGLFSIYSDYEGITSNRRGKA